MAETEGWLLYDLPPFSRLRQVGDEFGVSFRLYGGAASRLAMARMARPSRWPDLVDLAPFTSDIDLEHSGSDDRSVDIQAAIFELVPQAEWCRWSLHGLESSRRRRSLHRRSTFIPLRSVVIASDRREPLPEGFQSDQLQGHASIIPDETFRDPEAAWRGYDLEIFGLLVGLNAALDMAAYHPAGVTIARGVARRMVDRFLSSDDAERLGESTVLRRRLDRWVMALLARQPEPDEVNAEVLKVLSDAVGEPFPSFAFGGALLVSKPTSDGPRVPLVTSFDTGGEAEERLRDHLSEVEDGASIDPVFDFACLSRWIPVRPGEALSSELGWDGEPQEFAHVVWSGNLPRNRPITSFVVGRPEIGPTQVHLGVTAAGTFPSGANWVRIDIAPLVQAGASIALVVMLAAAVEAPEADSNPQLRWGGPSVARPIEGPVPTAAFAVASAAEAWSEGTLKKEREEVDAALVTGMGSV